MCAVLAGCAPRERVIVVREPAAPSVQYEQPREPAGEGWWCARSLEVDWMGSCSRFRPNCEDLSRNMSAVGNPMTPCYAADESYCYTSLHDGLQVEQCWTTIRGCTSNQPRDNAASECRAKR